MSYDVTSANVYPAVSCYDPSNPQYLQKLGGIAGVTLALEAAAEPDPLRQRGLRLEAIAQLAAVRPEDAVYDAALYDRALLLARVGRHDEARRMADEFATREPGSAWAERLRQAVEMERR
ncbi:MAG: hypothetical protein HZC42_15755 [Candidatus Eisenbacteria bacterium]|nr:hypothetical protein [Candidatus Eisenbacteria bacterium]